LAWWSVIARLITSSWTFSQVVGFHFGTAVFDAIILAWWTWFAITFAASIVAIAITVT
jgi:hypothetical protein